MDWVGMIMLYKPFFEGMRKKELLAHFNRSWLEKAIQFLKSVNHVLLIVTIKASNVHWLVLEISEVQNMKTKSHPNYLILAAIFGFKLYNFGRRQSSWLMTFYFIRITGSNCRFIANFGTRLRPIGSRLVAMSDLLKFLSFYGTRISKVIVLLRVPCNKSSIILIS